jgi:glucoamylase
MYFRQWATIVAILSGACPLVDGNPTRFHHKRATLDDYIANESPIAVAGVLNNIGPNGSKVSGAASGLVIASPSKTNPGCRHTQTQRECITPLTLQTFTHGLGMPP